VAELWDEAGESDPPEWSYLELAAQVLAVRYLRIDVADPNWQDRDRIVAGDRRGKTGLRTLAELGSLEELRNAPDWNRAGSDSEPAYPLPELLAAAAATVLHVPGGETLATAVGHALAERLLAARFGRSLVDHRTWVLASSGELIDGLTHEAIAVAGQLGLDRLTVLMEDTGSTESAAKDRARRLVAAGWSVKRLVRPGIVQIADAVSLAMRSRRPTLVEIAETGEGAEAAAQDGLGTNGRDQVATLGFWASASARGGAVRRGWLKRLARHPMRSEYERVTSGRMPGALNEVVASLRAQLADEPGSVSNWALGQRWLASCAPLMPELVSAGTGVASAESAAPPASHVSASNFAGRHVDFGMRLHGLASCLNGVSAHGGLVPVAQQSLQFATYMLPSIRFAAAAKRRVLYLFAEEAIAEAGRSPGHEETGDLSALRASAGIPVFRPADATEALECLELAMMRLAGSSAIVLASQALMSLRNAGGENRSSRGGYVVAEAEPSPRAATLIATGRDVHLALALRDALRAQGVAVAVVSLVCWELFASQHAEYREEILGTAPRFGLEAGTGFGWDRWLGTEGMFLGTANDANERDAMTQTVRGRLAGVGVG
jgi:transketolase